jgi:hypothetical protein
MREEPSGCNGANQTEFALAAWSPSNRKFPKIPPMPESFLQWSELLSYLVTIFGLPLAIYVFLTEQRKERQNEEEEIYQRLSDEYNDFLKLVIGNADLQLLNREGTRTALTPEQEERKYAIFGILVALFERAYILVYEENMDKQRRRLWRSWEDYMREWCKRRDFCVALPELLVGEDPDFVRQIQQLAQTNESLRSSEVLGAATTTEHR